nr:immunoglobulin light chain junction region [Macaca mulatta]MOV94703.1 immunoglobulin light chain junction region [Macaca mulatta]MOV94853.1 immunoglobulin light chain junction region [Macaca mulatta]MOV94986.1 immunoglobulin light chain junction region [Macaca mulatta]MOV95029.1 immunoglobulin light chain junction region [Macaca mulatta]
DYYCYSGNDKNGLF